MAASAKHKKIIIYCLLFLESCRPLSRFGQVSGASNPFGHGKDLWVWGDALNVMTFHRNKMNEYLCKNYIAQEILDGYQNVTTADMRKRNGSPVKKVRIARETLLTDEGSQKYQDWLARSSTLEDIYHQFEHAEMETLGHEEYEHDHEGSHDGEVTGYALLDSKHVYGKPIEYETDTYYHDEEKEDEKGVKLKELFRFALTSIAFLAFATFMIEVIMNLMENQNTSDYLLVPTTTGGTGPASKNEGGEVSDVTTRQTRSLILDPASLETLNIMSSKVLSSIEGLAILHEDDGECFQRALCQNSKYTKTLSGPQKMWLPLWSFGSSWISNRLSKGRSSTGDGNALKYLKAALMGLGSRECHELHPKCDDKLRRRRNKKKHR